MSGQLKANQTRDRRHRAPLASLELPVDPPALDPRTSPVQQPGQSTPGHLPHPVLAVSLPRSSASPDSALDRLASRSQVARASPLGKLDRNPGGKTKTVVQNMISMMMRLPLLLSSNSSWTQSPRVARCLSAMSPGRLISRH